MAIDGIKNSYQYQQQIKPAFLGLTQEGNQRTASYQGRYQGVPNTTPQVVDGSNTALIEEAMQFADNKIASGNIFEAKKVSSPCSTKGAQWDGYNVPENNGTGELIPSYEGSEFLAKEFCYMA